MSTTVRPILVYPTPINPPAPELTGFVLSVTPKEALLLHRITGMTSTAVCRAIMGRADAPDVGVLFDSLNQALADANIIHDESSEGSLVPVSLPDLTARTNYLEFTPEQRVISFKNPSRGEVMTLNASLQSQLEEVRSLLATRNARIRDLKARSVEQEEVLADQVSIVEQQTDIIENLRKDIAGMERSMEAKDERNRVLQREADTATHKLTMYEQRCSDLALAAKKVAGFSSALSNGLDDIAKTIQDAMVTITNSRPDVDSTSNQGEI